MVEPVLRIDAGAVTEAAGRPHNEDCLLASAPVFAVADGMGGHQRGDRASALVVATLESLAGQVWLDPAALDAAIEAAGRAVAELGTGPGAPGSTLAGVGPAVSAGTPCWLVFNIGDSRVYRLQGETLEQISVDHSVVQEHLDAGRPDRAAAAQRNLITRALGAGQDSVPTADRWLLPAREDDRMLVCSDGLTGVLSDQLIAAILLTCADPQAAARDLVRAATDAGATDNVTAVVVVAREVRPEARGADRGGLDTTVSGEEVAHG